MTESDECAALREDLDKLRAAVAEMRKRQREYFRLRPPGKATSERKDLVAQQKRALAASRAAEAKVDELVRRTATPALF